MKNCPDHSGVCAHIETIKDTGERTEKKIDRLQWWIITILGVGFVSLIFSMAKETVAK
jgi:hypothetical protein